MAPTEYRLSERGLCARLKFAAWMCLLSVLREEAQAVRENAIDDPGSVTLIRLDLCRSLVVKLRQQLQRNEQQALTDDEALAWNEDARNRYIGGRRFDSDYPPREPRRRWSSFLSDGDKIELKVEGPRACRRRSWSDVPVVKQDCLPIKLPRNLHGPVELPLIRQEHLPQQITSSSLEIPLAVLTSKDVAESYRALKSRLDELHKDLSETFQHLGISIQTKDSTTAKRQASRTMALTVIATIYLPATLVVGIFDMNIDKLGGDVDVKWPVIVFAALFTPSAMALLFLFLRE